MKLSQFVVIFLIIPNIFSEDYYNILYNLETLEKYMSSCVSHQKDVYINTFFNSFVPKNM